MASFYIGLLAIGIIQLFPGIQGIELFFGTGTVLSFFIFAVSYCIPGIGTLFAAFFVYYGARHGWEWPWWQSLLLAIPGLVLMIAAVVVGRIVRE
jgi:hypothetical protein